MALVTLHGLCLLLCGDAKCVGLNWSVWFHCISPDEHSLEPIDYNNNNVKVEAREDSPTRKGRSPNRFDLEFKSNGGNVETRLRLRIMNGTTGIGTAKEEYRFRIR